VLVFLLRVASEELVLLAGLRLNTSEHFLRIKHCIDCDLDLTRQAGVSLHFSPTPRKGARVVASQKLKFIVWG